jgi:type II secretory pathway pseudopilin PulG
MKRGGLNPISFLFGNRNFSGIFFLPKSRRAQVWIETVIYTLIALVIIGLALTFVQPKIMELQDRATLQQSISMLNEIDNKILSLSQSSPGNTRKLEINIRAGSLTIDGINDAIRFSLEKSHYQLSEPDTEVNYGDIAVYTHPVNELNTINMTLNYSEYNLTYQKLDAIKTITQASTPYNLFISNNNGAKINIDFDVI